MCWSSILPLLVLILFGSTCFANFVDPSDLFNSDETNVELSKKSTKGNKDSNSHETEDRSPNNGNSGSHSSTDIPGEKNEPQTTIGEKPINKDIPIQEEDSRNKDDALLSGGLILFQQFTMSVAKLIEEKVSNEDVPVDFCLKMKASSHDLSILKKFGNGDNNALHIAHEKLGGTIRGVTDLPDLSVTLWLERRLGLSPTVLLLIITALSIFFLIMKTLLTVRLTRSKIWLAFLGVFICSVAFTWLEMYQKKLADQERIIMDSKKRCPEYEKLGFWESISNYFSSYVTFQDEDCRELYEAMLINPVIQVSPLEAMAIAVVKTFMSPMKIIGEGIKAFITGLFKDMPLQYVMFLIPLLYIVIIMAPLMLFGYRIRIPWMLSIEPSPQPQPIHVRDVPVRRSVTARVERGQGEGEGMDDTDSLVPLSKHSQEDTRQSITSSMGDNETVVKSPDAKELSITNSKTNNSLAERKHKGSQIISPSFANEEAYQGGVINQEHSLDQATYQETLPKEATSVHVNHFADCYENHTKTKTKTGDNDSIALLESQKSRGSSLENTGGEDVHTALRFKTNDYRQLASSDMTVDSEFQDSRKDSPIKRDHVPIVKSPEEANPNCCQNYDKKKLERELLPGLDDSRGS